MRRFIEIVNRLSTWCGMAAVLLIAASILIVCQMVVLRYFFTASTTWQTDVVTFGLVAATLLGCPYLLLTGGHVNVDLVVNLCSEQKQKLLQCFARLVVLLASLALAATGGLLTLEAWHGGWLSETVAEIPLWMAYIAMPIGFSLLSLQALADILAIAFGLSDHVSRLSGDH